MIGLFFRFCLQQIFTRIRTMRILITVKPCFTDTNLIRTRHHYRQLSLSLGKAHTISSTRLIRTPINVDNGHLFLAQSTDSHRKSTLLMWTLHYQLYVVINLSFLKVKNLSVDSMSMLWALLPCEMNSQLSGNS